MPFTKDGVKMCKDCETCELSMRGDDEYFCNAFDVSPWSTGFERCPWPSRRKEKKDKYEEAYKKFIDNIVLGKSAFVSACKEAGLK